MTNTCVYLFVKKYTDYLFLKQGRFVTKLYPTACFQQYNHLYFNLCLTNFDEDLSVIAVFNNIVNNVSSIRTK